VDEAVTHLTTCAAGRSDWMLPRIILGQACLQLGRRDEARRWLREALELAQAQAHEAPAEECRHLLAELGEE
jgi:Flp pilus assembly protein TadD